MPNFATNSFAGQFCAPVGPIFVMQSPAAGTPLMPGQTTVVMQVCDGLGNCTFCAVVVNAVPTGGNPVLTCPPNQVIQTCNNGSIGYYKVKGTGYNGPIVCTPPSGTFFPVGTTVVTCTATNNCGGMATCSFTITVRPPMTRWPCDWYAGIGIAFQTVGGATMAIRPDADAGGSDGTAIAIPINPAICVFPNPNVPITPSGVLLHPGAAKAISFTTVLPFDVPENVVLELVLPPTTSNSNSIPLLSFRSKGKKGYCVKSSTKLYDDEPAQSYRSIAIGTNGELFSSFAWDLANATTNVLLNLNYQPGVTSVVMTVHLDLSSREVSIEFPYCIWTPDNARKGWDGCIYGNGTPSKGLGTNKTARLILTPTPPHNPHPPITDVALMAQALPEFLVEDATITAVGRKWGDGHVTLMKAYDDGEAGLEFVALSPGGGVHVDLGHSASFQMRLTHFRSADNPSEEQLLTRTIGPIALTNRPAPPPFLDALLLQASSGGVDCSADFSNLDSPTVRVQIYQGTTLMAERTGVPAQLGQPLLTLPMWPSALGKIGGASPCRRGKIPVVANIVLPGGAGTPPQTVPGDEFRILAELPPGAVHPDYYSAFEFISSAGSDWGITALTRVTACVAQPVAITRTSNGISVSWSGASFQLQGAETVTGPWFDLGVSSPALLPSNSSARFLRLSCD
jgi:hypothetical protein